MSIPDDKIAIGGEGKVTLNSTEWCVENITITYNLTEQPIATTCEYDPVEKILWDRNIVTGKSISVEFTMPINKDQNYDGTGPGEITAGKKYTGTVEVYSGKTYTGTWLINQMTVTNNGPTGAWNISVSMKSDGAIVRT